MTLKAVLFDFDGTIGDTLALCVQAFKNAIEPLANRTFTDEEIVSTFGPSEEGTILKLVPDRPEEGLSGYLREYERLHADYPVPFPGIVDLLRSLKRNGIAVGLITGKGPVSCEISLRQYQIQDVFDWIETGSPSGPCKPECMRRTLERLRLTPSEAVYVGDMTSDITASREAGIPVVSVTWASTADADAMRKMRPDALCRTVAELREYLEEKIGKKFAESVSANE